MQTAEIISEVCNTPPRSSLRYVAHRGDDHCGVLHIAEIISAVCCTPRKSSLRYVAHCGENFVIEYLNEIETEFENTLACLSVAQIGLNHEKKLDVENLVTHSL